MKVNKHQILKIAIVEAINYQNPKYSKLSFWVSILNNFQDVKALDFFVGKLGFCANLILKTGTRHIIRVTWWLIVVNVTTVDNKFGFTFHPIIEGPFFQPTGPGISYTFLTQNYKHIVTNYHGASKYWNAVMLKILGWEFHLSHNAPGILAIQVDGGLASQSRIDTIRIYRFPFDQRVVLDLLFFSPTKFCKQ